MDDVNYALSKYDIGDVSEPGWHEHGPVLSNREPGELDPLYWRPGEIIVWIVTRDERAMRGFEGLVTKLMGLHDTSSREIYEQSVHGAELLRDAAGHHRSCPRNRFEDSCDCERLGRLRYCRCTPAEVSWVGNCTCVPDALRALLHAVEDGLPLRGKRKGEDGFHLLAPAALGKLKLFYGANGLQLLPNIPDVVVAKADIHRRWPANWSDWSNRRTGDRASGLPELGRPPAYEEALTIFTERLHARKTKLDRLEEVEVIAKRMAGVVKRDTVTSSIRQFYRQLEWGGSHVLNAPFVIDAIDAYLDARRLVRVQAAKKRATNAG